MTLHPTYHKELSEIRVAYRPNNRWLLQRKAEPKGTRESDPWDDIGKAKASKAEAIAFMYQRFPVKQQGVS